MDVALLWPLYVSCDIRPLYVSCDIRPKSSFCDARPVAAFLLTDKTNLFK
jgi:hypothetical protein